MTFVSDEKPLLRNYNVFISHSWETFFITILNLPLQHLYNDIGEHL